MKTQFLLFASFSFIIAMIENMNVFGQASLAAENVIDDIKVTTKYGEQKLYTVFKDARSRNQWFYLPNEIRVAESVVNGKAKPKMTILKYVYTDVRTKEVKVGGILVAAFTYAMEPEVVNQVKEQIKNRKNISDVNLSAMPLNTSTVDFLSDMEFVGNVDAKPFGGSTSASQEIIISYNFNDIGTALVKAMASRNSGLPIRAYISYNSLTPPCGYSIKGTWDNVYKYFEQNKLYEGRFNFWVISGGGSVSKSMVRESLNNIQGMKVGQIECDSTSAAADDANREAIVKLIQTEVFTKEMQSQTAELEKLQSLLKSSDASAAKKIEELIKKAKGSIQLGYQKSIKDIQKRRKGEINYDFSKQKVIVRSTTVSGLLNFNKYGLSEEQLVEQGYIIDVDANKDFPSVIIGLPSMNSDYQLRSISFEISYKNSKGQTHSEGRLWEPEKGWTTPMNAEVSYIRFNLLGENDKKRLEEPEFDLRATVISSIPNASFAVDKKAKFVQGDGDKFVEAPQIMFKELFVDCKSLDYELITKIPTDLAYVKLFYKKGNIIVDKDIRPFIVDSIPQPPSPVRILLPNDDSPESGMILFVRKNGEKIEKPFSIGSSYTLQNSDWKTEN
jgi:hypothetical protein